MKPYGMSKGDRWYSRRRKKAARQEGKRVVLDSEMQE